MSITKKELSEMIHSVIKESFEMPEVGDPRDTKEWQALKKLHQDICQQAQNLATKYEVVMKRTAQLLPADLVNELELGSRAKTGERERATWNSISDDFYAFDSALDRKFGRRKHQ